MSFLYFTRRSRQFFVVAENPANVRSVTHFFGKEPGNDGTERRMNIILILLLIICCLFVSTMSQSIESIYDTKEQDINGQTVDFSDFKGKVLYIVNVASKCGYTQSNYEAFRGLKKYRDQGLEIFLAPCNQFGAQGTDHLLIA